MDRVLIADRDEALLDEYRKYSQDQFEVVTAMNGVECLNQIRQKRPDILVLEPQLHWGCGEGILTIMHEILDLASVPVMLLTSCSDSVLQLITRFPISDYHPKPLAPQLLIQRLRAVVDRSKSRNGFSERHHRLEDRLSNLIKQEYTSRTSTLIVDANG